MGIKRFKGKIVTTIALVLILCAIASVSLWFSEKTPIGMDEYMFYRLAGQVPDYSISKDWFYKDNPGLIEGVKQWEGYDLDEALSISYDSPIFRHPPLPVYIISPLVKGLNFLADKGYIDHIEGDLMPGKVEDITRILRFFFIGLSLLAFWLIYRLVKSKIGNYAFLAFLPIGICYLLLSGTMVAYWDAFMMFFFVLTLYLMETKPNSKWWYFTACCLVNTKMYIGLVFLIPLILENKKVALAALSIIPYWLSTWHATGEPFWLVSNYLSGIWTSTYVYSNVVAPNFWVLVLNTNLLVYAVMTIGGLTLWRKYPVYVTFWTLTVVIGLGLGMTMWTMSVMLYSGALLVPFIAHKFVIQKYPHARQVKE